jgi:hypothetical protein
VPVEEEEKEEEEEEEEVREVSTLKTKYYIPVCVWGS